MYQSLSLRVALGLGDQELEQRLRPALDSADDLVIVAQCLAADQLLRVVDDGQADAVVVAWSLHRLTDALLDRIDRPGVTLVMLVPDPDNPRWRERPGPVLAVDADASRVRQAVLSARRGGRAAHATRPRPAPEPLTRLKPADSADRRAGGVIAVTGGAGSPGRTTVAINLAAALGTLQPTVLVELDLCAPAAAAYLDLDPSRNICTLAHAVRDDPSVWGAALADELQPLVTGSSASTILCGPPKREMRSSVAAAVTDRLIAELAQRYSWVILDVGPEWLGTDSAPVNHRTALARAQRVVLVSASDLVGLWHARVALDQLERLIGLDRQGVGLVLNRHDVRFHHARAEVEWHLGTPVLGIIPFDQVAIQRATAQQRPAVVDSGSRVSRALLTVAERLAESKVRLPAQPDLASRDGSWWRRVLRQASVSASVRPTSDPQPVRTGIGDEPGTRV
ncbi:MAG TPA: hypothetical protein VF937_17030 [Chloroflexota bacterium]